MKQNAVSAALTFLELSVVKNATPSVAHTTNAAWWACVIGGVDKIVATNFYRKQTRALAHGCRNIANPRLTHFSYCSHKGIVPK